jgi:hypothetical protein
MAEHDQLEKLLHDLGRAMAEAMTLSEEVTQAIHRVRQEGFSLYLVLDGHQRGHCLQLEISTAEVAAVRNRSLSEHTREPDFRLDGRDVALLKSLGIDATRTGKRRRARG